MSQRRLAQANHPSNRFLKPVIVLSTYNSRQPSVSMAVARLSGPDHTWRARVRRLAKLHWTPHQRKRFAFWCVMQMMRHKESSGDDRWVFNALEIVLAELNKIEWEKRGDSQ